MSLAEKLKLFNTLEATKNQPAPIPSEHHAEVTRRSTAGRRQASRFQTQVSSSSLFPTYREIIFQIFAQYTHRSLTI